MLIYLFKYKINKKTETKQTKTRVNIMNKTSLDHLHSEFCQALSSGNSKKYLGSSTLPPNKLEHTSNKTIRLAEVFNKAINEIEDSLTGMTNRQPAIVVLKSLEKDGELIFQRYNESTKTWSRWFLKCLARYTPQLLKRYLPACFSNQMEKAENDTFAAYSNYRDTLQKIVKEESSSPVTLSPSLSVTDPVSKPTVVNLPDDQWPTDFTETDTDLTQDEWNIINSDILNNTQNPGNTSLQGGVSDTTNTFPINDPFNSVPSNIIDPPSIDPLVPVLSKEEAEKIRLKEIDRQMSIIQKVLIFQFFNLLRPLSKEKLNQLLIELSNAVIALETLDSNTAIALEKHGINSATFNVLKDPKLKEALNSGNDQEVNDLLASTDWHSVFQETLNPREVITFGIRKMGGTSVMILKDSSGKSVKDAQLQKFRGEIRLSVNDIASLSQVQELEQFFSKNKECTPCKVTIELLEGNASLTPELLQLLMQFKDRCAEIQVSGLKEIDFTKMRVSESEEHAFAKDLEFFHFPEISDLKLSDHAKSQWTAADFSKLLTLCPTSHLLKECYKQCSNYSDIVLPTALLNCQELDAVGLSIPQVEDLLGRMPQLTRLSLKGSTLTDDELAVLVKTNRLNKITALELEKCSALTTDSLIELAKLKNLSALSLPDLPVGKISLANLPTSENPFKIKMLYLSSTATRPFASQLYTGPQNWSALFQIPLARLQETNIFPSSQTVLDPKSCAYWLFQEDYKQLAPQKGITKIFAESNATLNDDKLIEFIQKFPETDTLSLFDCPAITDDGIIRLLQACPKIKFLDLTGCPLVTSSLPYHQGVSVLKQLETLTLSGSDIFGKGIALNKLVLPKKTIFNRSVLSISNSDLKDCDSLEKILLSKPLNTLKRIDLQDCTDLTDDMLAKLIDRFNAPALIQTTSGEQDNPQRLNLASLNLNGCSNITDGAFLVEGGVSDKPEMKFIEILNRIALGGTQISDQLGKAYPHTIFQKDDLPVTIDVDPISQLDQCLQFHHLKKQLDTNVDDQMKLNQLKSSYVHSRISVELFGDAQAVDQLKELTPQTEGGEFCDITLYFKTSDGADPIEFKSHRDMIYCQSAYFRDQLRPGGAMSKKDSECSLINQHCIKEAAIAVMELLNGNYECIGKLNWRTASHTAELVGPLNLNLPSSLYQDLLKRVHSQFDLNEADEMFESAVKLDDKSGIFEYQNTLIEILKLLDTFGPEFQKIANIADTYQDRVKRLKTKVDYIREQKNLDLINELKAEQDIINQNRNMNHFIDPSTLFMDPNAFSGFFG